MIEVDSNSQTLSLFSNNKKIVSYLINTAKNGLGEIKNSFCTPRGKHRISKKIGYNELTNTVFVGREKTGEIYSNKLAEKHPHRDWILTRILWLEGCEEFNKNSQQRYIYIHGTPDSNNVGIPLSQGCIRMRNKDIIKLFDIVDIGDEIYIF